MKVVIEKTTDSNDNQRQSMAINGQDRLYVGPLCECPEDAIIGRSLVSCEEVARYMKEAYEAGKAGEVFEVEIV